MLRRAVLVALLLAALVGLSPAATAKGRPQRGELTALSYNVAGLTQGVSGSDPAENSRLISPLLNRYDLVLLQEDWEDHARQRVGALPPGLPAAHYHHEIVSAVDHPHRSDPAPHPYGTDASRFPLGPAVLSDGLNRLSRLPFEQPVERIAWDVCHGELAFEGAQAVLEATGADGALEEAGLGAVNDATDGGASDCSAQKGFSVARTQLAPGVEVDVYDVHADAGAHPRDSAARTDGFDQLATFIESHSAGRAVLLGGDTNLKVASSDAARAASDAVVLDRFQAATGLTDVCRVLDCGADAAVHDKFFFRDGGGVDLTPLRHRFERDVFVRADGEPLSDHDPLAVAFGWRTVSGRRG